MIGVIKYHLNRYPKMQTSDVVKLLYQSCFGPNHFGDDIKLVQEGIIKEIPFVNDRTYVEIIGHDLVRFHFSKDVDTSKLAKAVIDTAKAFIPNAFEFQNYLAAISNLNLFKLDPVLLNRLEKNGYNNIHHSSEFVKEYTPHYRVIHTMYVNDLLK